MNLPEDVKIPKDKLLQYLLLPREENDNRNFSTWLDIGYPIGKN